ATLRCGGWSSSWLVLDRNTEESRSNVILPSGLGYAIGVHCAAGRSEVKSALPCRSVPKIEARSSEFGHMSRPASVIPRSVPKRHHGGLALGTLKRSRPMSDERQAAS